MTTLNESILFRNWVFENNSSEAQSTGRISNMVSKSSPQHFTYYRCGQVEQLTQSRKRTQSRNLNLRPHSHRKLVQTSPDTKKITLLYMTLSAKTSRFSI